MSAKDDFGGSVSIPDKQPYRAMVRNAHVADMREAM
jgi:hypothetical protein